jgi:hypothetical protein
VSTNVNLSMPGLPICGFGRPFVHDWTLPVGDWQVGLYQADAASSVLCFGEWEREVPFSCPAIAAGFFSSLILVGALVAWRSRWFREA